VQSKKFRFWPGSFLLDDTLSASAAGRASAEMQSRGDGSAPKQSAQALLDRLETVRRAFLYRMPFA
jgi:hypothetical protein